MPSTLIPLLALAAAAQPVGAVGAAGSAQRSDGFATAQIFVRIIKNSVSVGPGHAPPTSGASVRSTTIATGDGRQAPAIVTIFE